MGFLKGNVTFQRFRIAGPKPRLFDDVHLERLREYRAGRARIASADAIETGWAGGGHVLDAEFDQLKNVYTDHLLFDFWVQTDKPPTERLKAYYETDLKALAKNNPSGFASARQKREAKESARDRLTDEAKDGRWKKWKCIPVAWDAVTNTTFFGATSATQADRFTNLWEQTFTANLFNQEPQGGKLAPITAASLAEAINPAAKNEHLSPFVPGTTPTDGPAWCAVADCPTWLGNEFLLWLWYFAETQGDTLKLPDASEVVFMFGGGVKVEDPRGVSGTGTMNSDSAVRLPEAKAAVKAGKLPRKAALTLVRHQSQYRFVLEAETLAVSKAKLPPPGKEENQRERELARLQHVRDLAETIDLMFAAFINRRLSAYWSGELAEMQGWLKGGRVRA